MDTDPILKFEPFASFVQPSFWHKLAEIKLDVDKLVDVTRSIHGFYSHLDPKSCLIECEYTAFNSDFTPPKFSFQAHGQLLNKNTVEEFRECDKIALINSQGRRLWDIIKSGDWIADPSLLVQFFVLSFADLKKFNFYFCFGFPAPITVNHHITSATEPPNLTSIAEFVKNGDLDLSFFILTKTGDDFKHHKLSEFIDNLDLESNFRETDLGGLYFCFCDPSETEHPAWLLRNFLAALLFKCPLLHSKTVNVVSLKIGRYMNLGNCRCFRVKLCDTPFEENPQWTGWELNSKGKFAPKMASMAESMDPIKLAESSTNLNLKLMKWRLMPDLNLDVVAKTKCLLFGAGTLGCGVARGLMSWGVNHITFVDYGTVSYSNPVRQNLYRHEDALKRRPKAETAAERMLEIHPGLTAKGHTIHVPMPGHPIGDSILEKSQSEFELIEKLVKEHDVIFLLMDSRESRWLPTLLGQAHKKIVMNAALGFDSYLVMRHGTARSEQTSEPAPQPIKGLKCIPGYELGCYFCNDIVAPGNSLKDRTLDQQCTVTRPAVSNIAASLVVELLVSMLQHPDREAAPAFVQMQKSESDSVPEGLLGVVPHTIRGLLPTFEQILPATEKFSKCIACSEIVVENYIKNGFGFALEVFNGSKFLEDLTGITDLLQSGGDVIECGDSDFDVSD